MDLFRPMRSNQIDQLLDQVAQLLATQASFAQSHGKMFAREGALPATIV